MKKRFLTGLLALTLIIAPFSIAADVSGTWENKLKFEPKNDTPEDTVLLSSGLDLDITNDVNDNIFWKLNLKAEVEKLTSDEWELDDSYDFEDKFTFSSDEAYVVLSAHEAIYADAYIGKQHVKLGSGDGITTLGLFEPIKANTLDDITSSAPVWGTKLVWYPGDFTVTGFYQPIFTPAKVGGELANAARSIKDDTIAELLQQETVWQLLASLGLSPENVVPGMIRYELEPLEEKDFPITGGALKVSRQLSKCDLGFVYENGYATIPLPVNFDTMTMTLKNQYMPVQKVGATVSGAIGDISTWGELTYNIPKEDFFDPEFIALLEKLDENLDDEDKDIVFTDEAYVSGLVGADYFFKNGAYINLQLIHGLPQQVTKNMLSTALVGETYKTFAADRLKLDLTGIFDITNKGRVVSPKVEFTATPSTKVWLKGTFFGGDEDTVYDKLKDNAQISCGATVVF